MHLQTLYFYQVLCHSETPANLNLGSSEHETAFLTDISGEFL